MGFGVWGLGVRVSNKVAVLFVAQASRGAGVESLGFGGRVLGIWVWTGVGCRVVRFTVEGLGFGV